MDIENSIRDSDAKVLAVMIAIVAGIVGLLGFLINDISIDASRVEPIRTSHLSLQPTRPAASATTGASTKPSVAEAPVKPAATTPEENWSADESSFGLRPDAAH